MSFIEGVRLVGLVLLAVTIPLLVLGTSALDCLVVAVVGYGLSRTGSA